MSRYKHKNNEEIEQACSVAHTCDVDMPILQILVPEMQECHRCCKS